MIGYLSLSCLVVDWLIGFFFIHSDIYLCGLMTASLISGLHTRYLFSHSWISSTKSPASGAGNVSEPRLMSQVRTVREVVCAWIIVFPLSERWRCQYWSAYVAAAVT